MNKVVAIHHVSVIVQNVDVSLAFYHKVLGLVANTDRPELGYPGAWLDIGSQQIHLLQLPNPDPIDARPQHGGRDRHVALTVTDLDDIVQILDEMQHTYTLSRSGRKALFCRDPDGNTLEVIQI